MVRRKRDSHDPALKPVAAEILDEFVEDGPPDGSGYRDGDAPVQEGAD
jgi:hypothetical protein